MKTSFIHQLSMGPYMMALGLVILLFPQNGLAQNVSSDKLVWRLDSAINLKDNKGIHYTAELQTDGKTVKWVQKNGEKVSVYNVQSTEGSWADVTQIGSVVFGLSRANTTLTARFERTSGGTFITLDFGNSNISRFYVSSVQLQP